MISFSRKFPWVSLRASSSGAMSKAHSEPLREFVYLDEVSLASLLASQKGELTENITSQSGEGIVAEASGKIATNVPLLSSAEATSRFQTSNSSSLQTVRKANAQSLFRELHKLDHLRLIQPTNIDRSPKTIRDLLDNPSNGSIYKSSDLHRGQLVEFHVKLSASWIFQISTIVAEFSEIFDENPTLFMENVNFYDIYQAKNANKVINKLLAGLVPIDGLAPDYSVISYEENDYIVHNGALDSVDIEKHSLQIVGVTEHLAYWKDIRRILFSDNEFTMLCRISKTGIQKRWNPIKLADIFQELAPDLANQIEVSSKIAMRKSFERQGEQEPVDRNVIQLMIGLARYKDIIVDGFDHPISEDISQEIDREIAGLKILSNTAETQREAFAQVNSIVKKITGHDIEPNTDLAAREKVRNSLDISLFPVLSSKNENASDIENLELGDQNLRLLDVEVVAIYW